MTSHLTALQRSLVRILHLSSSRHEFFQFSGGQPTGLSWAGRVASEISRNVSRNFYFAFRGIFELLSRNFAKQNFYENFAKVILQNCTENKFVYLDEKKMDLMDFLVYSSPGNRLWIQITPWLFQRSENSSGRQNSPVMNTIHWGVLTPVLFVTRKFFFCKPVLVLIQSHTKKSTHWCIHHREVKIPQCIPYWGMRLPSLFTTGELRLPGVFITRESFWTLESCLPILRNIDNL